MNPTILAQPQISLRKQFSTGSGATSPNHVILKPAPGKHGTTARFSLLPQTKPRLGAMGASITFQVGLLAIILIVPLVFPQKMIPKLLFNVMPLTTPQVDVPVPAKQPPPVRPKPQPLPPPVEEAVVAPPPPQPKVIAPRNLTPKVQPKVTAPVEAPKVEEVLPTPKIDTVIAAPARPRPPVETGLMSTGSAAPATLPKKMDPSKVQTGGFGDPNGVSGPSNPNVRANVNGRGSFDLPNGPGYGNGTGGANGARGTVASAGFGNGTAIPPTGGGKRTGTVQSGGFSQATVETDNKPKQQQTQAAAVQPIVILEKPKPQYSKEARDLKIEGTVLVSVVFKANGEIVVQGIAKGLGHGLDELAMQDAKLIKYKPAISNGQPVDFPATVHIEFLLAY
ncbi:MAG: energy transducer TonB [Candidatus Acidiferrales bacterium]